MENRKHVLCALLKKMFGPAEQERPALDRRKYCSSAKIKLKVCCIKSCAVLFEIQFTAIDIWGAGVILLSILSSCSSFFTSPDDMTALAEIITLFGTEAIEKVASLYGKHCLCRVK